MPKPRRWAVLILAVVLLGACSSDSEDSSAHPSTEFPQTQPTESSTPFGVSSHTDQVPLAKRLERRLEISSPDMLVSGFGSVWLKRDDGWVERINPESGRVVARIRPKVPAPEGCQGLGVAGGLVWTCPRPGLLVAIDPSSDKVSASVPGDNYPGQFQLVASDGWLWLLSESGESLHGVDPTNGSPNGPTIELGTQCKDVTTAGSDLFVACPFERGLVRIDPRTAEITGEVLLPNVRAIAAGADMWAGYDGGVAQVDVDTLDVLATYDVYPGLEGGMFASHDEAWVRTEDATFLTRIDANRQQISEEILAPALPTGGSVLRVGQSVWASAYNDATVVKLSTN